MGSLPFASPSIYFQNLLYTTNCAQVNSLDYVIAVKNPVNGGGWEIREVRIRPLRKTGRLQTAA